MQCDGFLARIGTAGLKTIYKPLQPMAVFSDNKGYLYFQEGRIFDEGVRWRTGHLLRKSVTEGMGNKEE